MRAIRRGAFVLVIVVVAYSSVADCGEKPKYSGFLKDYPSFIEGKKGVDMVYTKAGVDFSKYNKIMMDEVVFYFKKDADYKGIHPSEIQELSEAFNRAFIDALNDAYPLTDKPGPDVMRVRVGITEIKMSKPGMGTVTTIIPVGLAVSLVKKGATGGYTGIGSASMEAEFLDSVSNERIGAAIDKAPGGKLDLGKLTPAKEAFEFWAGRLRIWLDEIHSKAH
ncbi:MAG: DUF3313 domain-containing protein [Thermodesulfobacteriota bacterium]|nr:DUF3313 domain-containing protein [Thermodesulfobacteriota bacterium]